MAELLSGTIDGAGRLMFDPHFTSRLETDNRTIWASRLDDEQLAGLICTLGNFQERCYVLAEQLDEHRAEIDPADSDYALRPGAATALPPGYAVEVGVYRPGDASPTRSERGGPRRDGPSRPSAANSAAGWRSRSTNTFPGHCISPKTISSPSWRPSASSHPSSTLIDAQLDRYQGESFIPRVAYARARTVLGILAEMVHGTGLTFDDVHARIYWRSARRGAYAQAGQLVDRLSPDVGSA